jgi:hypothetical protein
LFYRAALKKNGPVFAGPLLGESSLSNYRGGQVAADDPFSGWMITLNGYGLMVGSRFTVMRCSGRLPAVDVTPSVMGSILLSPKKQGPLARALS